MSDFSKKLWVDLEDIPVGSPINIKLPVYTITKFCPHMNFIYNCPFCSHYMKEAREFKEYLENINKDKFSGETYEGECKIVEDISVGNKLPVYPSAGFGCYCPPGENHALDSLYGEVYDGEFMGGEEVKLLEENK